MMVSVSWVVLNSCCLCLCTPALFYSNIETFLNSHHFVTLTIILTIANYTYNSRFCKTIRIILIRLYHLKVFLGKQGEHIGLEWYLLLNSCNCALLEIMIGYLKQENLWWCVVICNHGPHNPWLCLCETRRRCTDEWSERWKKRERGKSGRALKGKDKESRLEKKELRSRPKETNFSLQCSKIHFHKLLKGR